MRVPAETAREHHPRPRRLHDGHQGAAPGRGRGRPGHRASAEYPFRSPEPLWAEQDPALWWDGAVGAITSALALAGIEGADVAAVGLTGQMHGLVLLDAGDQVLRPAILWNDQRTGEECDLIRETIGVERLIAITGNDALPGFTAPKLLWVRRHEPQTWGRVAHVLLPKDFVRLRLTGDHATDRADGAGTLLFDLARRDWSPAVLAAISRSTRRGCRPRMRDPRSRA